ncbi:MAG: SCO family protein [Xanthomonadaceae bacterium]|nr:SCO family protein [Xanthomonadaceae bacterium]
MFNRNTLIVLAIAAAFAGLLAGWHFSHRPAAQPAGPELQTMKRFETPRMLPPFQLTRADGQPLDNAALKGHWTLVFIGFTHCPDVCPTTLAQLKVAQDQWANIPEARRPRVLFVSVDPERDTPEITGTYAHAFHQDTLAATGTQQQLEDFARGLSLVFMKNPPDDPAKPDRYAVDHSAALAVIDPEGRMSGVIQPPFEPGKIATDFIALTDAVP